LILCVYAINKKYLKPKRKPLFGLRFFNYRGEKRRGRGGNQERKNREGAIHSTGQIVIYLVRVLPERKSIVFCKQGKITPLLQKTIPEIEKRMKKHNAQKIIKI
jgi:hypothetical protein